MDGVKIRLRKVTLINKGEDTHTGELCCKHKYGFEGYIDENGNEDKRYNTSHDWFETGDLCRIKQNKYLRVLGRLNNSVNRSGFLVLFSDIEKAIEKIEGIEQSIVVTKGKSKRGQRIIVFCTVNKKAALDSDQIRSACFNVMPKYAFPDILFVISSLPTLPNGKVDRQKLVEIAYEKSNGEKQNEIGS